MNQSIDWSISQSLNRWINQSINRSTSIAAIRECNDLYGRQKMARISSDFVFLYCNPQTNHTEIKKCLLLFTANENISLYCTETAEDRRQKFHFCRLSFDVTACLISLLMQITWIVIRRNKQKLNTKKSSCMGTISLFLYSKVGGYWNGGAKSLKFMYCRKGKLIWLCPRACDSK